MSTLNLDLETFGTTPLRSHGAHRYAQDAEIMLVSFAKDDQPADVWDLTSPGGPEPYRAYLAALQRMIDAVDEVVTHGTFDRVLLASQGVTLPVEKHRDNMVLALSHGLPGDLDKLCGILDVPVEQAKDTEGKKLIQLFCSPCPKNWKLDRATRLTHPDKWERFVEYARLDVEAMRAVRNRLPRWNETPVERVFWELDQRTNALGMYVDQEHAQTAITAYDEVKASAAATVTALTKGLVTSTNQREKFLAVLEAEYGYVGDLTKGTLERMMRGSIDPQLRGMFELRLKASAASPAKYKALLRAVGSDGRLRDTLQFCGAARTGRDAGRIFQPQNLPRPSLSREDVESGVEAMRAGCADLLFEVSELVISAVRGSIIAAPGNKLIVSDLSNIEGRVLAWLAGEEWKLEAFREFDRGVGHDLYKITAGRLLGKDPSAITKDERAKMGKVPELAGGYQGSVGAYRKMGGPVIEALTDDEILTIVKAWRKSHPKTQQFWYDMENAAKMTLRNPERSFTCGAISFDVTEGPDGTKYLRMRLPSGRYLSYSNPSGGLRDCTACEGQGVVRVVEGEPYEPCEVCEGVGSFGSSEISYDGISQTTHQWGRQSTYGGKLVENAVQAIARDIFMHGMRRAFDKGYPIILRVHDELVAEVPDEPRWSLEELKECMTVNPVWTAGLPLAADGFETHRYFKD